CTPYRWEQYQFPHFHGHVVMFFLITKRSCHTTTSRWDYRHFISFWKCKYLRGMFHQMKRLLVTMSMQLYLAGHVTKHGLDNMSGLHFHCQEFVDKQFMFCQLISVFLQLLVDQIRVFIPESKNCRRLNTNQWCVSGDEVFQVVDVGIGNCLGLPYQTL